MPSDHEPDPSIDPSHLVEAILATLDKQLTDMSNQYVVLTRDEAIITAGLVGSLAELITAEKKRSEVR